MCSDLECYFCLILLNLTSEASSSGGLTYKSERTFCFLCCRLQYGLTAYRHYQHFLLFPTFLVSEININITINYNQIYFDFTNASLVICLGLILFISLIHYFLFLQLLVLQDVVDSKALARLMLLRCLLVYFRFFPQFPFIFFLLTLYFSVFDIDLGPTGKLEGSSLFFELGKRFIYAIFSLSIISKASLKASIWVKHHTSPLISPHLAIPCIIILRAISLNEDRSSSNRWPTANSIRPILHHSGFAQGQGKGREDQIFHNSLKINKSLQIEDQERRFYICIIQQNNFLTDDFRVRESDLVFSTEYKLVHLQSISKKNKAQKIPFHILDLWMIVREKHIKNSGVIQERAIIFRKEKKLKRELLLIHIQMSFGNTIINVWSATFLNFLKIASLHSSFFFRAFSDLIPRALLSFV